MAGGVTSIIGGQWGSEAKGVVAAYIAKNFRAAVRVGGPNAGHTFSYHGKKYVMRSVPCAHINPRCDLFLGAGAVIDRDLLLDEIQAHGISGIAVDSQAAIIPSGAHEAEAAYVARIGSTGEGIGFTRKAKIDRDPEMLTLAKDATWPGTVRIEDTSRHVNNLLDMGHAVMFEGTQGSGLSLHHGSWPYVTSEDTNVSGLFASIGVAPDWAAHTVLVARTYPIRVGGPSGPMGEEVAWQDIPGKPTPELTTVTKRVRRIAAWSDDVFRKAVRLNRPCAVVLTFADYLDPTIAGSHHGAAVMDSNPVRAFVIDIAERYKVRVVAVGTGGPSYALAETDNCSHGVPLSDMGLR